MELIIKYTAIYGTNDAIAANEESIADKNTNPSYWKLILNIVLNPFWVCFVLAFCLHSTNPP